MIQVVIHGYKTLMKQLVAENLCHRLAVFKSHNNLSLQMTLSGLLTFKLLLVGPDIDNVYNTLHICFDFRKF